MTEKLMSKNRKVFNKLAKRKWEYLYATSKFPFKNETYLKLQ